MKECKYRVIHILSALSFFENVLIFSLILSIQVKIQSGEKRNLYIIFFTNNMNPCEKFVSINFNKFLGLSWILTLLLYYYLLYILKHIFKKEEYFKSGDGIQKMGWCNWMRKIVWSRLIIVMNVLIIKPSFYISFPFNSDSILYHYIVEFYRNIVQDILKKEFDFMGGFMGGFCILF